MSARTDLAKLRDLIEGVRIAMLTTVSEDSSLHSWPMVTQEMEPDGDLWFFTEADAEKVSQVEHEQQVNLSYIHSGDRHISISGTAQFVRDAERGKRLWNPFVQAWFTGGPNDPNVGLLRVTVQGAEYWQSKSPRPIRLFQYLSAVVAHQPPDVGDHDTLNLSGPR